MTISFPAEEQRTLVVVAMPHCLPMSEMDHVSGWVKMVMLPKYILVTVVILIHMSLSPTTGSFLGFSLLQVCSPQVNSLRQL